MVSTQSKYDIEYVRGEFGENYNILIKNDDGSDADISAFDGAKLTVTQPDGTLQFTVTQADHLTITSPNVIWDMQVQETNANSYDGKINAQVELTQSTTKKKMTKIFKGFIYTNQVP